MKHKYKLINHIMKNIINWEKITLKLMKKNFRKCNKCNIFLSKHELLYEQWEYKKSYFCLYCEKRV